MKVLITGGCGTCASVLTALDYDTLFVDRLDCVNMIPKERFLQFNLKNYNALCEAIKPCEAIVHLASGFANEEDNHTHLRENVEVTHNVLKAANEYGIERVIFASSNHVVGMIEIENAPEIYEIDGKVLVDKDSPVRPDSLYGVSKVFGENLGRYYAENGGSKFYAIRIGAILDAHEDHPYAYAEMFSKKENFDRHNTQYEHHEKRLKAIWQSRRDFLQMINLCLKYDGPQFDIFYGTSDNPRSWMDISYAKKALGYKPQDNGFC